MLEAIQALRDEIKELKEEVAKKQQPTYVWPQYPTQFVPYISWDTTTTDGTADNVLYTTTSTSGTFATNDFNCTFKLLDDGDDQTVAV